MAVTELYNWYTEDCPNWDTTHIKVPNTKLTLPNYTIDIWKTVHIEIQHASKFPTQNSRDQRFRIRFRLVFNDSDSRSTIQVQVRRFRFRVMADNLDSDSVNIQRHLHRWRSDLRGFWFHNIVIRVWHKMMKKNTINFVQTKHCHHNELRSYCCSSIGTITTKLWTARSIVTNGTECLLSDRFLYITSTLRTLPSLLWRILLTRPNFHLPRTILLSWIRTTSPIQTSRLETCHFGSITRDGK